MPSAEQAVRARIDMEKRAANEGLEFSEAAFAEAVKMWMVLERESMQAIERLRTLGYPGGKIRGAYRGDTASWLICAYTYGRGPWNGSLYLCSTGNTDSSFESFVQDFDAIDEATKVIQDALEAVRKIGLGL